VAEPQRIVAAIRDLGPRIVALTLGKEGVLLADGETVTRVPGVTVEAVDATGAGDCFDGAFLARLALGDTPIEAARYAATAASLSTRGYGAVAPIPRPDEVRRTVSTPG
jgi:2-dehydro-3-deoxygluconokinase